MVRLNLPKEKSFTGPAQPWKRVAAFVIDMAIINFVVFLPFKNLFLKIMPSEYTFREAYGFFVGNQSYAGLISTATFIMAIISLLYFLLMEKNMGQTIGKRVMRIYVTGGKSSLKTWQVLIRNAFFLPVFPFILLWIIDPLFMFFNKTGQRLSEILSKTNTLEKFTY